MQFRLLPAAGCRTSKLLFLLARSNETEADKWADCEQNPNRTKLLFVSSPLSPTPSRNAAKMSSTKHGAAWGAAAAADDGDGDDGVFADGSEYSETDKLLHALKNQSEAITTCTHFSIQS